MLDGVVQVPDDRPIDIDLDFLIIEADEDDSDELASLGDGEVIPFSFHTDRLVYDEEDYGSWTFSLRPEGEDILLDDLRANVKGLTIADGARLVWQYQRSPAQSRFDGRIQVADLATALREWGFASSIEGEGFILDAALNWPGSPTMIDLLTVNGELRLEEGNGRFVQAEAGGAFKLLGVFDFASLARRFRFDFSDVVQKGVSFTNISGTTKFSSGRIDIVDPIVIEASGSTFKIAGKVDLRDDTLDNDMIVTLPVNRNLPWYAAYSAIATGPVAGAGVWIAQQVFADQIDTISSAKYAISGTLDEPVIEFVSMFDDSVREAPEEESADSGE
jgi:uncharacterized protein YhdP